MMIIARTEKEVEQEVKKKNSAIKGAIVKCQILGDGRHH